MAALSKAVSTSLTALRIVRQYLSNPALIFRPVTALGFPLPTQVVVMQATSFRETLSVQASKMLLVDVSQGKSFLNDNVAPMPTVWEIEGFLFPLVPSIPDVDQIQLEALKDTVRQAMNSRQLVQFKPVSTSIVSQFSQVFQSIAGGSITGTIPVIVTSVDFTLDPVIQNKAPFRMTIQKIDTLSSFLTSGPTLAQTPDGNLTNPAASAQSNSLGNTVNAVAPAAVQ